MNKDTTRDTYNKIAIKWKEKHSNLNALLQQHKYFSSICKKKSLILDAGCGYGRDIPYFISRGFKVIGIDYSKEMLKLAKKSNSKAIFRQMDMRKIKFANSLFGGIWSNAAIHHLKKEETRTLIRKFNKLLKPGGVVFVGVLQENEKVRIEKSEYGLKRIFYPYSLSQLRNILKENKFRILKAYVRQGKEDSSRFWIEIFAKKMDL